MRFAPPSTGDVRATALVAAFITVGAAIAASALLPHGLATACALVVIIGLGVPHGALDGEIARDWLRPRVGVAWAVIFAVPYLALATLVLVGWRFAPAATLALFLAASVWHFGEDRDAPDGLTRVVMGGAPVAVPCLAHPGASAALLGGVAGLSPEALQGPLVVGGALWIVAVGLCLALRQAPMPADVAWRLVGEAALFIVLPPLTAFAVFFVCLHAPAHVAAVLADRVRAKRVRTPADAIVRAAPWTLLTILLGAAVWPMYAGSGLDRLLMMTFQGLAALTLPHMLLEALVASDQPSSSRTRGITA